MKRITAFFVTLACFACGGPSRHFEGGPVGPVATVQTDAGTQSGSQPPHDAGASSGGDAGNPNAFFDLLDELTTTAPANRQARVDAFVETHGPVFPHVQDDVVSFVVLNSNASQVALAGDVTCWSGAPQALSRVSGSNLWHVSYKLPKDARNDYKFIVDGQWILDPLNPRTAPSGFGVNSEVSMPAWVYPSEIDHRPNIPHGTLARHSQFQSAALNNARDIDVYLPPGYPSAAPYPSFYVHDGGEYLALAKMVNVLDGLIADGKIAPLVVVFVPPVNRSAEYVGAQIPQFSQFITSELVPFIDSRYQTATDATRRGMMGTSNGGYITLRIGYDHPNLFRRLAGQSSAIAADGEVLIDKYANSAPPDGQRIYVSTGTLCDFTTANDKFDHALAKQGYAYTYEVFNEGHSWGLWRGHLDNLLTYLWPPGS